MYRRRDLIQIVIASAIGVGVAPSAKADDQDDAENLALATVTVVTDGDLASFYQNKTTPAFKNNIRQDDFTQAMGVLRIKLAGPPRTKPLVQGSQKSSVDPLNRRGDFYFVRCRANYVTGALFWDIWLERSAGEWRVAGINYIPAPPV